MSATIANVSTRIAGLLLGLYPQPWRERYRSEVTALIEDDPPRAGGLASLLLGAADAHLRPTRALRGQVSPVTRMRLSLTGLFCCWILLCLSGIGFQKDTEEASFAAAGARHPLLGIAHGAVLAGALLGAGAIAVGGLPLVWHALRQLRLRRDRRLALALLAPGFAVLAFGALTWLLVTIAPARAGHEFPASFMLLFQAPWRLAGWACAAVCALAPRTVLARIEPAPGALRRASFAGGLLVVAMAVVASALMLYAIALPLQAGALAAESTAPFGASTGSMLAVGAASACAASLLALVAARRALMAATSHV